MPSHLPRGPPQPFWTLTMGAIWASSMSCLRPTSSIRAHGADCKWHGTVTGWSTICRNVSLSWTSVAPSHIGRGDRRPGQAAESFGARASEGSARVLGRRGRFVEDASAYADGWHAGHSSRNKLERERDQAMGVGKGTGAQAASGETGAVGAPASEAWNRAMSALDLSIKQTRQLLHVPPANLPDRAQEPLPGQPTTGRTWPWPRRRRSPSL